MAFYGLSILHFVKLKHALQIARYQLQCVSAIYIYFFFSNQFYAQASPGYYVTILRLDNTVTVVNTICFQVKPYMCQ